MNRLYEVNTHELGEVIDMIKDIEECLYYCSIVKAMNNNSNSNISGLYLRDMDKEHGRMYFDGERKQPVMYYTETNGDTTSERRKRYMQAKQNHTDKATQLKELEAYMNDLSTDIVEMIDDASTEERQYLERKMIQLADKVGKLN